MGPTYSPPGLLNLICDLHGRGIRLAAALAPVMLYLGLGLCHGHRWSLLTIERNCSRICGRRNFLASVWPMLAISSACSRSFSTTPSLECSHVCTHCGKHTHTQTWLVLLLLIIIIIIYIYACIMISSIPCLISPLPKICNLLWPDG